MDVTTEQKRQQLCDMLKGGKGEVMGVIFPFPEDEATNTDKFYFMWKRKGEREATKYIFDTEEHAQCLLKFITGEDVPDI